MLTENLKAEEKQVVENLGPSKGIKSDRNSNWVNIKYFPVFDEDKFHISYDSIHMNYPE